MANREQKFDIYERIFRFVVNTLRLTSTLPRHFTNQIIFNQVTRSSTSMGANSEEADGSNSRKDFLHCFTIVRKEAKETVYWLRLLEQLNPKSSDGLQPLINEGKEISAIITTIIKNTLNKQK